MKNVIEDRYISVEDIANAPLFKFKWKNQPEGDVYIGTSAQYWNTIIPEAVMVGDDNKLLLNYTTIAAASAISLAKEIVTLKEEKAALVERVEALEARLQIIESKLNA